MHIIVTSKKLKLAALNLAHPVDWQWYI